LVVDTNSDQSYTSLQDAVTAAAPGDALFVKGTCTGATTIGENLTITGQSNGGNGTATLNGGGSRTHGVLQINSATVTLNTLIITGGRGGGIYNFDGTATLNDSSSITGNQPDKCVPLGSVTGCIG
jgi:putative cofactor-binding repeat protein